jgi:hypothetical protein
MLLLLNANEGDDCLLHKLAGKASVSDSALILYDSMGEKQIETGYLATLREFLNKHKSSPI